VEKKKGDSDSLVTEDWKWKVFILGTLVKVDLIPEKV
jgi:hypothetical protein